MAISHHRVRSPMALCRSHPIWKPLLLHVVMHLCGKLRHRRKTITGGRTPGAKSKMQGKPSFLKSAAARARSVSNLTHTCAQQQARAKKSLMVKCPRRGHWFSKKVHDDDDELLGEAARKVLSDAGDATAGGDVYWLEAYAGVFQK